jgi:hypothetical protein
VQVNASLHAHHEYVAADAEGHVAKGGVKVRERGFPSFPANARPDREVVLEAFRPSIQRPRTAFAPRRDSVSWTKVPTGSPTIERSSRTDFPVGQQRVVVDGGVREGYPESQYWPGIVWIAILFFLFIGGVGLAMLIVTHGFP